MKICIVHYIFCNNVKVNYLNKSLKLFLEKFWHISLLWIRIAKQ